MPYPRAVVFEACKFLGEALGYHGEFDDLVLGWELDDLDGKSGGGIRGRCRDLFRHVRDHPELQSDGRPVADLVVEEAARRAATASSDADEFHRALERAGLKIDEDGQIKRTMPRSLEIVEADDEVHELLKKRSLNTPLGHLDQAIANHSQGNWASANAQIRTFFESLLDEIARALVQSAPTGENQSEARREALSKTNPPFLDPSLNEWGNQGKNLVNGTLKRLHPSGSHPGLSNQEDSTFRLHLVLLISRLFLRRFDGSCK